MLNKFFKTQSFLAIFLRSFAFLLVVSFFWPVTTVAEKYSSAGSIVKAEDAAREALAATLFYRFQEWANFFKDRIAKLESEKGTIQNQLELMKYYFFMAGINVEWSHALAFTSQYKIDSLAEDCYRFIKLSKEMANKLLDSEGLTDRQKAESYLYLGAAEGYLGIFEYGAGNLFQALINGLQADGHLEEALSLDPARNEAYLGLGIYRYGNSRVGGIGNFIMQGGRDLRQVGIEHLERSVRLDDISAPLAIKTLIWFYISEQINPVNKDLANDHPLSAQVAKVRSRELMGLLELKFLSQSSKPKFPGNKELVMMEAIQDVLDGEYEKGKEKFLKVLKIIETLKKEMGFPINPQQAESIQEGIKFTETMEAGLKVKNLKQSSQSACRKIQNQIDYMDNGGSVLQYDSEAVRNDIDSVFYERLVGLSNNLSC
jgi:tetratricopeptide (TPR) repeat protein